MQKVVILRTLDILIYTATKIPFMYSFSGNWAAIFTFTCLWAINIFPGSVHIFPWGRTGRPILEIYKALTDIYECRNWETEHYNPVLEITVSYKWEPDIYIGFSPALHLQCSYLPSTEIPCRVQSKASATCIFCSTQLICCQVASCYLKLTVYCLRKTSNFSCMSTISLSCTEKRRASG
jgi:hypothetical protein